jgi:hypothetical protein
LPTGVVVLGATELTVAVKATVTPTADGLRAEVTVVADTARVTVTGTVVDEGP